MSKSKRNYTEPELVFNKFGADALRIYLCQSRAVHGDDLKFMDNGVENIVKVVLSRWYNAYNFFIQNATRYERDNQVLFKYNKNVYKEIDNIMDRWILSELQSLIKFVRHEMEQYKLFTVAPKLVTFIDLFCNCYVKLNNLRIRGLVSKQDSKISLQVLYSVLLTLCKLMAPLSPFIVETMYLNLRYGLDEKEREESVHFLSIPTCDENVIDTVIERQVRNLMEVIRIGRNIRDKNHLRTSQPLSEMVVYHQNKQFLKDVETLQIYVCKELNVKKVLFELSGELSKDIKLNGEPKYKSLGNKFEYCETKKIRREKMCQLYNAIRELTHKELVLLLQNGTMMLEGVTVTKNNVDIGWNFSGDRNKWVCNTDTQSNTDKKDVKKRQKKNKKNNQKKNKKNNQKKNKKN
eukprot:449189_1